MSGNKLATGGLVAILFALWLSALATTDNPVGEITNQGRSVVRELRSQGPRHDRETVFGSHDRFRGVGE